MQRVRDFVDRLVRLPWSRFPIGAADGVGHGAPSSVQAIVAQLRYWLPTVADVAHVAESDADAGWGFSMVPRTAGACPLVVAVSDSGKVDLTIAGETYKRRTLETLDQLLPLIEQIVDGRVIQRRWTSGATGKLCGVETIVQLGHGRIWRDGMIAPEAGAESRDHHFLPYRRI